MSSTASAPSAPPCPDLFANVDAVLRDVHGTLARIRDGRDLGSLARAAIVTLTVTAALFGGVLGAHRGGVQILYAAVKMPLTLLLTAVICAPALTALHAALGRTADLRRDLALFLVGLARFGLVLTALIPVMQLAAAMATYHQTALLVVGCCGLAGLVGLAFLARGVAATGSRGSLWATLGLAVVFALVGAQMSWSFRPWLLRPRSPEPVFVRGVESSLFESVGVLRHSADGLYDREAPLPSEEDSP